MQWSDDEVWQVSNRSVLAENKYYCLRDHEGVKKIT